MSNLTYKTKYSAGLDLASAEAYTLKPGERKLFKTLLDGPLFKNEPHSVGLVCPRSGLALKHGITVLNAPGIVDEDYEGNVGVVLYNASDEEYSIAVGERIAQLVTVRYQQLSNYSAEDVKRGENGFGSTGR